MSTREIMRVAKFWSGTKFIDEWIVHVEQLCASDSSGSVMLYRSWKRVVFFQLSSKRRRKLFVMFESLEKKITSSK